MVYLKMHCLVIVLKGEKIIHTHNKQHKIKAKEGFFLKSGNYLFSNIAPKDESYEAILIFFDNAEIIELHHNQKKDAPSGTAIKTALMMSQAKDTFKKDNCPETETIEGSRGGTSYSDIQIHSVRMPGYIASQEVIFGSSGQIFTIRHDTMDRKCYMAGVLLAVKHVAAKNDFVYGLDNIMH